MSRIRTFLIGRHQDCDLQLDDSSVSRCHAEVILTADDQYYITDRNSSGGTFVYNKSNWDPIRQQFVNSTDRLRFGHYEMAASRLERLRVLPGMNDGSAAESGNPGLGNIDRAPDDNLDPRKGLRRDPATGEVMEKS